MPHRRPFPTRMPPRWVALLALLPVLLLAPPLVMPAHAAAPPLTVLAAGDLRGEIEPCGCSPEGQMGGLPRRLAYLAQALGSGPAAPLLVDLGNNFPEPTAQGRLKIDLIRTLLQRYAPAAVLPGPGEIALGAPALADGLPYVVSNDALGRAFTPVRTVRRAGGSVGIYGYLSPQAVYQGSQRHFRLRAVGPALLAALRERIRSAGHARTLLLFRGADAELAAFVAADLFDGIVAGNPSADELQQVTTRRVGGVTIPQVPTKGQGVLRLRLPHPDGAAQGTTDSVAAPPVDWLTDAWADHPAAAEPFAAYEEAVKALFFARLAAMEQRTAASPYAGAQACAACHKPAAAVWEGSRHAHAVATLERVGKQFDPECLACHVVGLERQGFLSGELTPHLANVQCENCHGPGRAHAADPANAPMARVRQSADHGGPETLCRECHHGSHSPTFDFAAYWPRIRHGAPGEGAPQAAQR